MATPRFYDDRVREGLTELSDDGYQQRLWSGLIAGSTSSLSECLEMMFGDSGLDRALEAGEAYGEPTDELLRQIGAIASGMDLSAPVGELAADDRLIEIRLLAAKASALLEGRPLGTVVGDSLDPLP